MANWRDPALEYVENITEIKLIHVIGGLYIWEFLLNIDFECSIVVGRRKFTLTSSLYITCRWCTLLTVIFQFLGFDAPQRINCQALITTVFILSTLAYLSASALTILRIFALWEQNRVVIMIASTAWLANAASFVYSTATLGDSCVLHVLKYRIFILSTFATDLVLVALMLGGVLHWKMDYGMGRIWWVLFTQGLAWVVIFTVAEVPLVVFISLNLNDVMDRMFTFPAMVVMTVAASRMYLGLVNSSAFHSPPLKTVSTKGRSIPIKVCPSAPNRGEGSSSTGGSPESHHLTDDTLHEGDVV